MQTPDWAKNLVSLEQRSIHHGYSVGCCCSRCRDRSARARYLRSERRPNADTEAMKQSDAYFKCPWLYRMDPAVGFARPLKELTDDRDR